MNTCAQKLAEGYHSGFQQYIGDRRQAGVDIFTKLEELLNVVVRGELNMSPLHHIDVLFGGTAIRIRAHETVLALFHALLDVFKALTGGPNTKNRVPTAMFATG